MTAQIIQFPSPPKITSWAKLVTQRAISTKPAYITSSAILNRAIMNLELAGWTIYPHPCGSIECEFYHADGSMVACDLGTAQRLQRGWDLEQQSR